MDDEDILRSLKLVVGKDEGAAAVAYDRLCSYARPLLTRYAGARLSNLLTQGRMEAEELAQDVLSHFWSTRFGFDARSAAEWRSFLYHCADNRAKSASRAQQRLTEMPDAAIDSSYDADAAFAAGRNKEAAAEDRLLAGQLYDLATVLFLGLDPKVPQATRNRQLIAANLAHIDGQPWQDILRLLGSPPEGEPILDRDGLDAWLADPGVLAMLAFDRVYLAPDELAAEVLGIDTDAPEAALNALTAALHEPERRMDPPAGWDWTDVAIAIHRCRQGCTIDGIREYGPEVPDVDARVAALCERLPHRPRVRQFLRSLGRAGVEATGRAMLRKPGIWQRLALQHEYADDLPQEVTLERVQPPADEGGYAVTTGSLTQWLSSGRLVRRLASFCAKQGFTSEFF